MKQQTWPQKNQVHEKFHFPFVSSSPKLGSLGFTS